MKVYTFSLVAYRATVRPDGLISTFISKPLRNKQVTLTLPEVIKEIEDWAKECSIELGHGVTTFFTLLGNDRAPKGYNKERRHFSIDCNQYRSTL
jgi:hypothetical protein